MGDDGSGTEGVPLAPPSPVDPLEGVWTGPDETGSGETDERKRSTAERLRQFLDAVGDIGGSTLVVIATAFGFSIGAVTLAAFSTGIGVPVTDLGLDLRGYVTIAGGAFVFPALVVGIVSGSQAAWLELNKSDWASNHLDSMIRLGYLVFASWVVGVPLAALLVFGTAIWTWGWFWGFVALIGVSVVLVGVLAAVTNYGSSAAVGVTVFAVFVVSISLSGGSSYLWAKVIKDGDSTEYRGPLSIELVVPVERGTISISGETACVDRVGTNVLIGSTSTAVITEWGWFLIDTSCERQPLIRVLDK